MASSKTSRTHSGLLVAWLLIGATLIIQGFAAPVQESRAQGVVYDQVGGALQGAAADAVHVTLYAWGGSGPRNVVQLVAVAQVTVGAAGHFGFRVARGQGQHTAGGAGVSFRGWAVRVEGVQCGQLAIRPPAQRLRDNCEAGWLIRPWQRAPLVTDGGVTFTISGVAGQAGGSALPTPPAVPTATPSPPAVSSATPVTPLPPPPTPVSGSGDEASPTALLLLPLPTVTPLLPNPPGEPSIPTAAPALPPPSATLPAAVAPPPSENPTLPIQPTVTAAPFVIDVHPKLMVTPQPTTAAVGAIASATPGLALAPVAPVAPPSAGNSQPQETGKVIKIFSLDWWLAAVITLLLIIVILSIYRGLRQRRDRSLRQQYSGNDDYTYDDFGPSNLAAPPAGGGAASDPYSLLPPGSG